MYKLRIGDRLRELRVKTGFTQSQIAKMLNIDRSTYSYYEIGKTTPDLSTVVSLSKIFNIPLNDLLSDEITHQSLAQPKSSTSYLFSKKNSSHIYELSGEEKELVGLYRVCSEQQRKAIMEQLLQLRTRHFHDSEENEKEK